MKFLLLAVTACMVLSGCYASCATGDPLGLFTYCPKESYEALMHPKPYGAHWVKDGMTRESRLDDTKACGSGKTEYVLFSTEKIKAAMLPGDPNEINAMGRLSKQWAECMEAKGYNYLKECDARCMYP